MNTRATPPSGGHRLVGGTRRWRRRYGLGQVRGQSGADTVVPESREPRLQADDDALVVDHGRDRLGSVRSGHRPERGGAPGGRALGSAP